MDGWEEVAEIWDPLFPDYELAANEGLRPIVYKLRLCRYRRERNPEGTISRQVHHARARRPLWLHPVPHHACRRSRNNRVPGDAPCTLHSSWQACALLQ
ncbi:hypothetical protein K438DRAFT_1799024 [Mycena galopus ATCC 62051]|nr:hypothetical protein K438DRAFT_1799024 [Mycena galopus ATCC 62051]